MTASPRISIRTLPARTLVDAQSVRRLSTAAMLRAKIIPIDAEGRPGRSHPVEIENVDRHGITFQHELPLSDRRATIVLEGPVLEGPVLEGPGSSCLTAEVELSWCRFRRVGHYTSGGRFVAHAGKTA